MPTAQIGISILLRLSETIVSSIVLGLTAGFVSDEVTGRTVFILITSIISLLYLWYIGFWVPVAFNGNSPSIIILFGETFNMVLYLISWIILATDFPTDCNTDNDWSKTSCHIYQALLPFTILNWILFTTTTAIYLGRGLSPELREFSPLHIFAPSNYFWGSLFFNLNKISEINMRPFPFCCIPYIGSNKRKNDLEKTPNSENFVIDDEVESDAGADAGAETNAETNADANIEQEEQITEDSSNTKQHTVDEANI